MTAALEFCITCAGVYVVTDTEPDGDRTLVTLSCGHTRVEWTREGA